MGPGDRPRDRPLASPRPLLSRSAAVSACTCDQVGMGGSLFEEEETPSRSNRRTGACHGGPIQKRSQMRRQILLPL